MAVPKIAVIALVAIIAVPILLGYALNLTEITETDYKLTDETVNVTPLLQNGTAYTYAHGNIYQLNTNMKVASTKIMPLYENITVTKTSLAMYQYVYEQTHPGINRPLSDFNYISFQSDDVTSGGSLNLVVSNGGTPLFTVNNLHSFYYVSGSGNLSYSFYSSAGDFSTLTNGAANVQTTYTISVTHTGTYLGTCYLECDSPDYFVPNYTYTDFSSGFYLTGKPNHWTIQLPNNTRSSLITIDLDSITAPNYSIRLGYLVHVDLEKTTDGLGNVTWTITNVNDPSDYEVLYYNPSGDNTYQLKMDMELIGTVHTDPNKNEYKLTFDFRYVGEWPTIIGEANYYNDYSISRTTAVPKGTDVSMPYLSFFTTDYISVDSTPRLRVDDALFRAYEYSVIQDQIYSPSSFKTNPSTKISDVQNFGSSIEFGGNTYAVSDEGKITLGSHQISVNNLILSSVPNDNGGYDNKIGNTVISTSGQPSTIKFNGQWSASIETTAQESYTHTKTQWTAGSFAWDGMDQNFLIVGLITSLGAFIGLGIYARKRGSGGIIPLMIVTGCAAAVFFVML